MAVTRFSEWIGPTGADYAMGGETEMLARLRSAGHGFVYVPGAVVGHLVQPRQVTQAWLDGRAYRLGRGTVRLAPKKGCPSSPARRDGSGRVTATAGLKALAARARPGRRESFESRIRYHRLRGQLREYRLLAAERRTASR